MKIIGTVQQGKGEGKVLGFPTANLKAFKPFNLENGVYLAEAELSSAEATIQGKKYHTLAVRGVAKDLEVFLLDFEGNLYNQILEVEILKKMREIIRFDNKKELVKQIEGDIRSAKEYFNKNSKS